MEAGVPPWVYFSLIAVAPIATILGFWMNLSSRITQAEISAENSLKQSEENLEKITLLSTQFGLYREHVASNYIHRDVMREVEDRLMQAIDRLADRLDRVLENRGNN